MALQGRTPIYWISYQMICNWECKRDLQWYGSLDVKEKNTMSVLNDMFDVRDGWGSCSILNTEDVNFIIIIKIIIIIIMHL